MPALHWLARCPIPFLILPTRLQVMRGAEGQLVPTKVPVLYGQRCGGQVGMRSEGKETDAHPTLGYWLGACGGPGWQEGEWGLQGRQPLRAWGASCRPGSLPGAAAWGRWPSQGDPEPPGPGLAAQTKAVAEGRLEHSVHSRLPAAPPLRRAGPRPASQQLGSGHMPSCAEPCPSWPVSTEALHVPVSRLESGFWWPGQRGWGRAGGLGCGSGLAAHVASHCPIGDTGLCPLPPTPRLLDQENHSDRSRIKLQTDVLAGPS